MDRSHLMQVADIERACFSHPWSLELLEQELYNDMLSLIVAEGEDGTVLGYGEVRAILDEGTLEKIAVAPAYRRQGWPRPSSPHSCGLDRRTWRF